MAGHKKSYSQGDVKKEGGGERSKKKRKELAKEAEKRECRRQSSYKPSEKLP